MMRFPHTIKKQSGSVRQQSWFPTVLSGLILALAGLGDTLLYPTLPLFAAELSVPLLWVGVLLSINKWIRLGGNHALALAISRLGYKRVATLGVLLAAASTLAYGINLPLWLWLISRIAWGMAFAALRLCALGYATSGKKQGLHLGINKAVKALGPMSALFIGPVLITQLNVHVTFQLFAVVTAFALPLTWLLPDDAEQAKPKMNGRFSHPTWFDGLIFVVALADGIMVVTIGLLLLNAGSSEVTILALSAFFLAIKRLSVMVVGPISGWLADKWYIGNLFLLSIVGYFMGLILVTVGTASTTVTITGITTLFVSTAITQTLAAGVVLDLGTQSKLNALSALTTWRDLGTAVGALIGGYLLVVSGPSMVYGILAILVLALGIKVGRQLFQL
ncbi:MAG: MFS transporter [Chloroflexota bacterium]